MNEQRRLDTADLFDAAEEGDVEAIVRLAERPGFDVDTKNDEGHVALMICVKRGHLGAARVLLSYSPNIDDNDNPVRACPQSACSSHLS